jgi:N,N'-diacetyllegionaminate synthase
MHTWHTTDTDSQAPYIIADAGVNHNGDINKGFELIEIAKQAEADCVKFQAFTADDLAIKHAQKADYQLQGDGSEQSQHEMLKQLELSLETFAKLKNYSDTFGIDFLTTPFSPYWVDQLVSIGNTAFKISSGSIGQTSLLTAIDKTK